MLAGFLRAPRDLRNALVATAFFGASSGIFMATLNNYLSEVHDLDASARGWLELPRELPGFFIMLVAGFMLLVLRESQMAALAMLLSAAGALGLGFLAPTTTALVLFIVLWSLGDHVIFAVEGPIGLKLADGGREGRRLGQLGGARNLGVILGVGAVFCLARLLGERTVLAADELLLLGICLTYAFASDLLPMPFALWSLYGAYILDSVLFALRVARTTYLGKIADDPADITPTVAMGITVDHSVAMSLPVLSGYIWEVWGFRWVFVLAGAIALAGFFICLQIRVPDPRPAPLRRGSPESS